MHTIYPFLCVCAQIQIGFEDYAPKVRESRVDGDILLILTDDDLQNGLNMLSSIVRKR